MADRNKFEEMLEKLVNEDLLAQKNCSSRFFEKSQDKFMKILLEDEVEDLDVYKEDPKDEEKTDESHRRRNKRSN